MEYVDFVTKIGEWLWTPAGRELGYMFRYKKKIQSLNVVVAKLEATKNDHQRAVDVALLKGDEVKSEVEIWLKDADKAITDARKLNGAAGESKTCLSGSCPNLIWRRSLGKKAVNATEEIKKIKEEGSFETVSLQVRRPIEFESTMSTGDFEAFGSTRQAMDQVMKALKDDKVTVIGVHGMGGIGKTTMVKPVSVQARKDRLFDHVIMAVISQNPNLMKVQRLLADLLAIKLEEEAEIARAARLKERILRGNKTLIILDDIWKTIDLSSIGIPDHHELQGCNSKVILTTRIRNVCHGMKCQEKICLDILSEEDSWTLFVKRAGRSFESTSKFYDVARKIARECGGLPIALIAVAKALGDKDLDEWPEAARRLEMSQPTNLDDEGDVFKCIKLSYDYLKGDDAKSCFLLCCLFQEDSDIQIEDLLKYGIGKGLFQDASTMQEARSTAHLVAKYLKASSLLLDSEQDGCVRMHDVIRDMAISIASSGDGHGFFVKAGCALKDWPNNSLEGYSAVSLIGNEICRLPEELVCPKIQILLLQSNTDIEEIPEAFFQASNALRVLDVSSTSISSLHPSFNLLANLQTLHLNCCQSITDVSILGALKKLEILSLRESVLEELPEEIGHLTNLRMLDLTLSNNIETIPPKVVSRLSRLEELYMQASFGDWGKRVEGPEEKTNASFDELTCLFSLNLLKVDISDAECMPKNVGFHPDWVKFDICISTDPFTRFMNVNISKIVTSYSRALLLDTTINTLPDWFNSVVTGRLEKLILLKCRGLSNILVEYDNGKLHGLKFILVQECYWIATLMDTVTWVPNRPVFENLEELRVHHLDCLKELCVGELPQGSLGSLKLLEVQQCNELGDALLQPNLLRRLQNLEVLSASTTHVEFVFRFEGLEQQQIALGKLREMKLENLPKLTNIWKGPAQPAIFHDLKTMTIFRCKKLKNLFTFEVAQCLLQLEELWMEDCHSLDTIIGLSEGRVMDKTVFPELKNLGLLCLPQLTSFCPGSAAIECPSLEYLNVQDCPQFLTSASDFHSKMQVQENNEQHLLFVRKRGS